MPKQRADDADGHLRAHLRATCCSRECSRSACAISWPITAAISSSVAFSFWIRPVYIAILPPGMHQAFTSSIEMTCTSHCHLAASGRKAAVCGIRRWVMACDALHLRGVAVEHALLLRLGHHLRVGLLRAGLDLLGGHHHALVAVDADDARLRGFDALATGQEPRRRNGNQRRSDRMDALNVCGLLLLTAHSPARFKPIGKKAPASASAATG